MTGAMSVTPPRIVRTIPQLMPRIDADGNELDGIRSPLISAPLGSYVGWNIAASGFEKGRYCGNVGGYIPFAVTKAERLAKGDPRPSLEERYPSHAAYVAKVKAAGRRPGGGPLHAAGRCGADRGGSGGREGAMKTATFLVIPAYAGIQLRAAVIA